MLRTVLRPAHPRRGDSLKTVLVVIAILGGIVMLSCLSVGVAGYFWFKRNLSNAAVTDPVKIRAMTTEQADIVIPAEFVPQAGSQIFGMHVVSYQWCPTGTCPTTEDDDEIDYSTGTLTLTTFATETGVDVDEDEYWEESFTESNLNERFRNYTKDVKEFTIRGKTCKFFIVKGEEIPYDDDWDDSDEPPADADTTAAATSADTVTTPPATEGAKAETTPPEGTTPAPTAATPATADTTDAATKPGQRIVWIEGVFPGKKGDCTLNLYLLEQDYDETKILAMLQSIR